MSFLKQHSVGLGTTTTAGRNAGVSTSVGEIIYNATDDKLQMYTPAGWVDVANIPFAATGGDIIDSSSISGYKVHIFTSPGDFTVQSGETTINYAIVAGGGGGAGGVSGGSGGGGYRTGSIPATPGPYPVTIGNGGASNDPAGGQPSQFSTIHVYGGGRGSALVGGCGGGANYQATGAVGLNPSTPAPVIAQFPLYVPGTTEGRNGGNGGPGGQNFGSGGGGGTQSDGANGGATFGGNGGQGIQIPATLRTPQTGVQGGYVGGGGGGGTYQGGSQGSGGPGGGGSAQDVPGTANTGGGCGGSSNNSPNPGIGGSGLVVVSYEVV